MASSKTIEEEEKENLLLRLHKTILLFCLSKIKQYGVDDEDPVK